MPQPLVARHFRPTFRIGGARIGATGDGLHASESPTPGDIAHVVPKHLLRNMEGFAEESSGSKHFLLKMESQSSPVRSSRLGELHPSVCQTTISASE